MYCPKCKNEYRKGIEICPECKLELVEELARELDLVELFRSEDEALVNEVGRYFEHITLSYEINTDEETAEFILSVDQKDYKKARMEAATVIKVYSEQKALEAYQQEGESEEETEEEALEDVEETLPELPDDGKAFVSAKDRTADYKSSGILFIIMGIFLIVFGLINYLKLIEFVPALMSQIALAVIGLACIIMGISSVIRSKALKKEISGEEELIKNIKASMEEKYPPLVFAEMMENSDTTPELRYLQIQEEMKKELLSLYPSASVKMLDELIEEYTDSMFN